MKSYIYELEHTCVAMMDEGEQSPGQRFECTSVVR